MRVKRAFGWVGAGLIALGAVAMASPVGAVDAPVDDPPIELELAVWSADVADAMLLAEPELTENPFAVLVRFADGVDGAAVDAVIVPIAGRIVGAHTMEDGSVVHVIETRVGVERALAHLRGHAFVAAAEPDRVVMADALTDDTHIGRLWALDGAPGIDVATAWAAASDAETVVVGVIDSGVQTDHPDLVDVMWTNPGEIAGNGIDDDANGKVDDIHGWDWVDDDADPNDPNGHGTHVAGSIAAVQNNALGVAGVADNVEIMALRFLNSSGSGYTSDAIAALEYALDQGVRITNNSWGGGSFSWTLGNLIEAATDHLFVAAAGNSSLDLDVSPQYPAAYGADNIVSVASHDSDGERSYFSNYGQSTVDLSAPGRSIYSTVPGSGYGWKSGTSMAAPHVAGIAALMLGVDPTLTPVEIIDLLERTVRWDDASIIDTTRFRGHVDAGRAVSAARPDAPSIELDLPEGALVIGTPTDVGAVVTSAADVDLSADVEWYVESIDGAFDGSLAGTGAVFELTVATPTTLRVRAEVTDEFGRWNVATWTVAAVTGPPSAPIGVEIIAGDGEVIASWAAPLGDGGNGVGGYIATASPGGASCGTTAATSCTIDGLANGVEYTVSVVAFNGAGDGPVSTPSNPATPVGAPSTPTSIAASAGDETIEVSWSPPDDDGGTAITGYEVLLVPSGRACVTEATSCSFDGLVNGEPQEPFVWAVNAVGASDAVSAGVVTPASQHIRCEATVLSSSFEDLPATSFAVADVECLRVLGITNGTSATTYSPSDVVTREQMAAFLARLYRQITGDECAPTGSSFTDLSPTSFARTDVECLRVLGITNGTSATTYSPSAVVTREQMASFLSRLYRVITGAECAPPGGSFADVSPTSFALTDIECLLALEITNGTSATTYSPDAAVTREQMAAFIGRIYREITT